MEEEDDEIEELCIIAGSWEEVSLDERRVENSETWITFPEVLYQLTLRHLDYTVNPLTRLRVQSQALTTRLPVPRKHQGHEVQGVAVQKQIQRTTSTPQNTNPRWKSQSRSRLVQVRVTAMASLGPITQVEGVDFQLHVHIVTSPVA
ncbi:hypothetical protein C0Q70_06186 [Pomacea canaliculata]|uniref:Uncharacterized protein n=1 Tax=Pomacea canaliculata TaxID=400727 RepID=A0A2T7PNA6_POMCA|nr:hypothetical protein C0Q70_06186 [Pomacea canaliculata]